MVLKANYNKKIYQDLFLCGHPSFVILSLITMIFVTFTSLSRRMVMLLQYSQTFFFCFYLILLQLFQKDFIKYSSDGKTLTLQEFQAFIIEQKCDPHLQDSEALTDFMRDFVRDPRRNVDPPFFTAKEVHSTELYFICVMR